MTTTNCCICVALGDREKNFARWKAEQPNIDETEAAFLLGFCNGWVFMNSDHDDSKPEACERHRELIETPLRRRQIIHGKAPKDQ